MYETSVTPLISREDINSPYESSVVERKFTPRPNSLYKSLSFIINLLLALLMPPSFLRRAANILSYTLPPRKGNAVR